jgi:hypothetical protein
MKKIIVVFVLLFFLICYAGTQNVSDIKIPQITLETYSKHLMYYFENKNEAIIYETISIYENEDYNAMLSQIDHTLLVFLFGIKIDNIERYNTFMEIVKLRNLDRLYILFEIIENNFVEEYFTIREPSTGLNDVYWTLYFSTGNLQYIDYLLNVVKIYFSENRNASFYLAARSAMWSISSNILIYPLLKDYIINNNILSNELREYLLNTDPNKIENDTNDFIRQQKEKGIW